MNCERMETLLVSYLDGRAREGERRDVEAHLAACAACRTRAEEFRGVWNALDELPAIEPSLGFDARLGERIAAGPQVPFRLRAWRFGEQVWAVCLPSPRLAFALVLILALSIWISAPPVENTTVSARSEEEFRMIRDLTVLEDYDVLANFEALPDLPKAPAAKAKQEM